MKCDFLVSLHTVTYIALKTALVSSSFDSSSFTIKSMAIKAHSSLGVLGDMRSLYSALCTALVF